MDQNSEYITLTTDGAFDSTLTPLSELELALVLGGLGSGVDQGVVTVTVDRSGSSGYENIARGAEISAVRDQHEPRGGGSPHPAPASDDTAEAKSDADESESDADEPVQVDEAGEVTVSATPEPKLTNWEEFKQRLENTERREQWQQIGAEWGAKIGIPVAMAEEAKRGPDGRLLEAAAKGAESGATLGRHAGDVIFFAEALKDTYGDDVVDALDQVGEGIGDAFDASVEFGREVFYNYVEVTTVPPK